MEIRLQKALSENGNMSRRKAEGLIAEGKIEVNGKIADIGMKIDPVRDTVTVSGEKISFQKQKLIYIVLNKPKGYITSVSDEKGRKTVMELVSEIPERIYPVGRLDFDSEGLLILTNDGEFANKVMHPSFEKEKTYVVTVSGLTEDTISQLSQPMEIDGYKVTPAKVTLLDRREKTANIQIKIHEGRNRQIRKMCERAELKVKKLRRVEIGGVYLGNLPSGKWRYMTQDEISSLTNAR